MLLGGLFYFMILRPQQRRSASSRQLIEPPVDEGDETHHDRGHLRHVIVASTTRRARSTVEIAPGTQIRMVRAGHRPAGHEDEYDDEDGYEDDDEDDDVTDDEPDENAQGPSRA